MPPSALPSTTQVNPLITCEGIRSVLGRAVAALSYPSRVRSRAWPTRPHKRSLECLTCHSFEQRRQTNRLRWRSSARSYRRKAPGRSHQPRGGYRGTPSPSQRKLVEAAQPRNSFWAGMNRHLYRASHQAGIGEKSHDLARFDFRDLLAQFDQPIGFHQ